MKKFGRVIILIAVLVLLGVLIFPLLMGTWVKHNYYQLISFYNSQGNFQIKILDYKRKWYSANADIAVEILHIPQPIQFTVKQNIHYGPVLVSHLHRHFTLELAAIHNAVSLSPESMKVIQPENVSDPVIQMDDDLSFSGRYDTHFASKGFRLIFPDSNKQIFLAPFSGKLSLWVRQQRFKGAIDFSNIAFTWQDVTITAPGVAIMFDEQQSKNGLWLGMSKLFAKAINAQDGSGRNVIFTDVQTSGSADEKNNLLNGTKQFSAGKFQMDEVEIGPLSFQLGVHDMNAAALSDLFAAYKKMYNSTESVQFAQQLFNLMPMIFSAKTKLTLDALKVKTPDGDILVDGEVSWPKPVVPAPQSVKELLVAANAKADMRITIVLAKELLGLAADLNYIGHRLSNPEKAFLDGQNDVNTLEKQNALLIAVLIQDNQLPKPIGMQLINDVRAQMPFDSYIATLAQLLADKKISPFVVKTLSAQYEKIKISGMSSDERLQYLEDQFADQFNGWVKQGLITKEGLDYLVSLTYQDGTAKLNGKNF